MPRSLGRLTSDSSWQPRCPRCSARSNTSRASSTARCQIVTALALRLGVDTRIDARATEDEFPEPDSGGFIGYLSPEALLSPGGDVTFVGSVRIPVIDALTGDHDESAIASLAVAVDF